MLSRPTEARMQPWTTPLARPPGSRRACSSPATTTGSPVVTGRGGRVVKLLGDTVMWVSLQEGALAGTAPGVVAAAASRGLTARAGLALAGQGFEVDGDLPPLQVRGVDGPVAVARVRSAPPRLG